MNAIIGFSTAAALPHHSLASKQQNMVERILAVASTYTEVSTKMTSQKGQLHGA